MAITIRLGDGKDRTLLTSEDTGAPVSARVKAILDKYAPTGESGLSAILENRMERASLLKELRIVGMEAWVKSGGKARFEHLVKLVIGRTYDGYISDHGRWERAHGKLPQAPESEE